MIDTLPQCRWRAAADGGLTTCSSVKIVGGKRPFDPHKVCRGCELADHRPMTDDEVALRAARMSAMPNGMAMTPPEPAPATGPGTELKAIFAEHGIEPDSSCSCDAKAAQMNRWGPRGCREHRAEIIGWFVAATSGKTWDGIAAEIMGALVDLAIERAEEKISAHVREFERHALTPISVHRFDEKNLIPGTPGQRFNASIIRYEGRTLLAWRLGTKGASILLSEIVGDQVGRTWPLELRHRLAQFGREDPRLFIFRGGLYVAFTGVASTTYGVLYARIDERDGEFSAGQVWAPDYAAREVKEKNHGFFEEHARLYCVYSISPFVILSIDGSNATKIREHAWNPPWQAGVLRGGASPVWVPEKKEWYCFFHGVDLRQRMYSTGCMTFDATFTPKRCTRFPIAIPSDADRPPSEGNSATYVCGSIWTGSEFILSSGEHNHWINVATYKASDVEAALEAVQ